jgi:hypothetical protein
MKYFFIFIFCLCMTGCAFHARSKSMIASELYQVYFEPERPYSELSIQIKSFFDSLGIKLVKNKSQAPFSIIVSNDLFSYSRPDIVDASLPTTLNFSQTAFIEILNNHSHKVVASREFNADQSLTLNANQIYTADSNSLIRQQLNRQIVSLIYYWLISSQTKESIHDANHIKTTRHAA